MTERNFAFRTTGLVLFVLAVLPVCDADDVALTVKTPATVNAAVLTAQMDGTKTFKLTSVTTDPTGAPIAWTPSPDVGNEAATFDISGASLTPATRHTVTLQLEDGVDSTTGTPVSNAGKSVELGVCTLPVAATTGLNEGLQVDESTADRIKITWTNPTNLGGVKVALGTFTQTITDSTPSEYTFAESAPGTPLVAGFSGVCEVNILGVGDCIATESATLSIQGCQTRNTNLIVSETITSDSISLACTLENTNDLTIGGSALTDSTGAPVTGTNDATSAAATQTLTWQTLSPNSKYDVTLTTVEDATDSKRLYNTKSLNFCTKPSQASVGNGQGVIEDGTTATEIKIVWTNPITPGGGIKVSWGQSFEANLTSSTSEYIFRESAPGTPLTAGQSGTCKVTIWGSGDCSSAESTAVEIQNCDTKDTNLVVRETITANSISLDCTLENGDDLSIGTATLSDSNSVPVQGTNDASTAAASHTLKWQNLSPNSKYYLSLTVPKAATVAVDQGLIEDETTTTEIKIKWTNPSSLGGIKVTWGDKFEANLTSAMTEYIFKESAPGTPLTAGQSGTCKVIVWGSGGCSSAESTAVEIQNCNTKSAACTVQLNLVLAFLLLLFKAVAGPALKE